MDALTCILTRRSALSLTEPAPSPAQLAQILRTATLAPDHKLLRPWRFVLVRGEERQRLGEALAAAAIQADPAAEPTALAKQRGKPLRAPLLVALIASPHATAKLPKWEQQASTAAAAQNICLAAHALGVGSAWKSTHYGTAASVRAFFAMHAQEDLFGWIELGTAAAGYTPKQRPEVPLADVVSEIIEGHAVPYRAV